MNWVWLTHHHVPTSELSLVTGSLAQLVEHQAGNLRLWVQFPHEATFSCFWFFPPGGLQILRLSSLGYFSEQKTIIRVLEMFQRNLWKCSKKLQKLIQKYLEMFQKYLEMFQKYLEISQKYLEMFQKYLEMFRKYLEMFKAVWSRNQEIISFRHFHLFLPKMCCFLW